MFVVGLLLLASVAVAQTKSAGQAGGPKVVHQDELFIVGIEARTTAAKEMSAQGVIPQEWQKFMQEGCCRKSQIRQIRTSTPSSLTSPTSATGSLRWL